MKKIVLIIDDEDLVAKTISRLLIKSGCEVHLCRNGEEALTKIADIAFDLLICDVRMPGLSGIETIKRAREITASLGRKASKEIIITGYAEDSAMKEAEQLQVADYIYKPFDLRVFLDAVAKNLGE